MIKYPILSLRLETFSEPITDAFPIITNGGLITPKTGQSNDQHGHPPGEYLHLNLKAFIVDLRGGFIDESYLVNVDKC